jgi:hypothetical protein
VQDYYLMSHMNSSKQPKLSVIVVVHNMPQQAMNTLYSLSSVYQKDVLADDYEVLVVENDSGNNLDSAAATAFGPNFYYYLRDEAGISPAAAINEALERCEGHYVGLLIDGARMLSPGVLKYAMQALTIPNSVVTVPGYYLTKHGLTEHGTPALESSDILAYEEKLLKESNWQQEGYQLFSRARFSNGNRHGYLEPMMECNALFCDRSLLQRLGGAEECFNLKGGGALNLHMYRQVATATDTQLITLPGEGNFHQFHGGTSTTPGSERDVLVKTFKAQLDEFWPGGFKGVRREPILFGTVGHNAFPFLQASIQSSVNRLERFQRDNRDPWEDDKRN